MFVAALCAVSLAGVWAEVRTIPGECDLKYYTHYKEFGCEPVFTSGPCPVKYNCDALNARRSDKCYFKGKEYSIGEELDENDNSERDCRADCICTEDGEGGAGFSCAVIECPEDLGPNPRIEGCRLLYEDGKCCSVSHVCPKEIEAFRGATCNYHGKTFLQGEMFEPENECKVCLCKEGFNGTLVEPWCTEVFCGMELHQAGGDLTRGCTPVYYKQGCCPIDHRCPDSRDQVLPGPDDPASRINGAGKCVFGSLHLNVNDKLNSSDACVDCTCKVPPVVTCMRSC